MGMYDGVRLLLHIQSILIPNTHRYFYNPSSTQRALKLHQQFPTVTHPMTHPSACPGCVYCTCDVAACGTWNISRETCLSDPFGYDGKWYGGFHSHGGTPIAGWCIKEIPMKMDDDWGYPPFMEPPEISYKMVAWWKQPTLTSSFHHRIHEQKKEVTTGLDWEVGRTDDQWGPMVELLEYSGFQPATSRGLRWTWWVGNNEHIQVPYPQQYSKNMANSAKAVWVGTSPRTRRDNVPVWMSD